MKKPFLRDLQAQLLGQVTDAAGILDRFSTDASIFQVQPTAVVYPKNTADVRRTVLLALERHAAGKPISITARGLGTDLGGGALGDGLVIAFPAHMNKVLDMDRRTITVQPGANLWTVQQLLHAQARFLPPFPASLHYSTVGGAVANNAAGVKSVKYGAMRDYVRRVKVVLADGSLVTFGRITARQLQRKKGQTDLEGEIYRRVDSLVTDHRRLFSGARPKTLLNAAGYALERVKGSDGSIDLAQLIAGSQGTLGMVTEIVLETVAWNPKTYLTVGYFDDLEKAGEAIEKLRELSPSSLEMVDGAVIDYLRHHRPEDIAGLVPETTPRLVLLAEFDDQSQLSQLRKARRAAKVLARYAAAQRSSENVLEQEALWRIRQSAGALWLGEGFTGLAPVMTDAAVSPAKLSQLLTLLERLVTKHEIELAVWGSAGTGQVWVQPIIELGKKKAKESLPKLMDDYYETVISLGGTTTASQGDGIIRSPYLKALYGEEAYGLIKQVKEIFDPQGIFNPLAKFATPEQVSALVRPNYDFQVPLEYLPQS